MKMYTERQGVINRRQCLGFAAGAWALDALGHSTPAGGSGYVVSRNDKLRVPDVPLTTMHGRSTTLGSELDTDDPVWLNFVFTTCSTTCSMQTAVLVALQERLRAQSNRSRFLSLTIDPDNDTPSQLSKFAARFGIQRDWQFCTGKFDDLLRPQQVFDVYRGSKASHPPVVMLRAARVGPWWRVEGFPTAADLHAVLSQRRKPA